MQTYEDALAKDLPVVWQPTFASALTETATALKGTQPANPFGFITRRTGTTDGAGGRSDRPRPSQEVAVTGYLLRRVAEAVVVAFLVVLITFVLLHAVPGGEAKRDPRRARRPRRGSRPSTTRTGSTARCRCSSSATSASCSPGTSASRCR